MTPTDETEQRRAKMAELESALAGAEEQALPDAFPGPPPLRTFGLVLHHDGSWTHEGHAILNRRMLDKFACSVRYLPDEGGVYVVQIGRFRGMIEVEEAGFFVREIDLDSGAIRLSDGGREELEVGDLRVSDRDGALLCRVKRNLAPEGLLARFVHSAQSEFMNAIDESGEAISLGGRSIPLPNTLS